MTLRQGIVELFEAIPERIEVAGQAPTWRVTGGSVEAVLAYAREALAAGCVPVAREDRSRWWPRVTLTVTTDPALSGQRLCAEELARPVVAAEPEPTPEPTPEPERLPEPTAHAAPEREAVLADTTTGSFLDEVFERQEAQRIERARVPRQRRG